jgi:nitrous oxide reductase accessory protein NosL
MRKVKSVQIMVLVVATLLTVAAYAVEMAAKCPLCGMNIAGNENTAYELTLANGTVVTYCCAHCGLYAQAMAKDNVKSARTRDFISGEWMDPAGMTFLFKSSAVPACGPSWIAFGNKGEAEKFQKGFGGTIYSFSDALAERGKMPKDMEMSGGGMMKEGM